MISTGDKSPAINLPATGGADFDLATLNAPCVVFFYPKDNTPGCTTETQDFSRLKSEFDSLGVELVGISPDSIVKHNKFREKYDLTVMLAADEDKTVIGAYGVWVEKSMYGRKYMGVERSTFYIDETGIIRQIWRKVRVKNHAEAVLTELRQLLNKS